MKINKSILIFRDDLSVKIPSLNKEQRKKLFVDADGKDLPRMYVTIEATHAGFINKNKAFYRPDVMKDGLVTYTTPFNKPVLVHHDDKKDPVGRIVRATYIDTSNRYIDPIKKFKAQFGGKTFIDAKTDYEKARDQYNWLYDNLMTSRDYRGLGYAELEAAITDQDAAEKILDQRYLTVSIGFSVDAVHCSTCNQNWADEGPCEHSPGKMYDKYPMSLIPANMYFDELSWVNSPADPFAMATGINKIAMDYAAGFGDNLSYDEINVTPILFNDLGGTIYRINFCDNTDKNKKQEVIEVMANKKDNLPELINIDGSAWEKRRLDGLSWESRIHYLAEKGKGDMAAHRHRCMIDPQTLNGFTDWVEGHSHEVVDLKVKETRSSYYDNEKDEYIYHDPHTHPMGEQIPKLGYDTATRTAPEAVIGAKMAKKKMKKVKCSIDDKVEEKLIAIDEDIPEGWELVEEIEVDEQDQMPPKAGEPKAPKGGAKRKKKKGAPGFGGSSGQAKEDSVDGDDNDEGEEDMEELANEGDGDGDKEDKTHFGDEALNDKNEFYDSYIAPLLDELKLSDAKLSTEERQKLKSDSLCGPNKAFPIPDCAHVNAAKQLIDRYTGKDKKKVLAAIERKARALGCTDTKHKGIDIITFNIGNEAYAISDLKGLNSVLKGMPIEEVNKHSQTLFDAAAFIGVSKEQWDMAISAAKDAEVVQIYTGSANLEEVQKTLDEEATKNLVSSSVDTFLAKLNEIEEGTRAEIIEKILAKLQENGYIPDYDAEYADAINEKEELLNRIDALTRLNKDLYLNVQTFLSETIVDLKIKLNKENYTNLTDEDKAAKINDLQVRSVDSLRDTLSDLITEVLDTKKEAELNSVSQDIKDSMDTPANIQTFTGARVFVEDTTSDVIKEQVQLLQNALFRRKGSSGTQGK